MTPDEKLAAILAAVQTDPGNRGLARDPHDNLFTATAGDFQRACRVIVEKKHLIAEINTGFYIPAASAFETDGPLGCYKLYRSMGLLGFGAKYHCESAIEKALWEVRQVFDEYPFEAFVRYEIENLRICIERAGPSYYDNYFTMRGLDTTQYLSKTINARVAEQRPDVTTIGIGDGGNEIGMGKIPHETIVKNIPNGDLIHCRVPTDHLIVAGVSNWGAYALAAGLFVLKGVTPPPELFDPDREREILEVMVKAGPLVDGVTGEQTATVDGLTWDEYVKPLIQIRDILAE